VTCDWQGCYNEVVTSLQRYEYLARLVYVSVVLQVRSAHSGYRVAMVTPDAKINGSLVISLQTKTCIVLAIIAIAWSVVLFVHLKLTERDLSLIQE